MPKLPIGMAVLAVGTALAATAVLAVSERVKRACQSDYYAFCSEHAVDSPSLRFCMRRAQARLSQACVKELARSNEVTRADIKRYKALKRQYRFAGEGAPPAREQVPESLPLRLVDIGERGVLRSRQLTACRQRARIASIPPG